MYNKIQQKSIAFYLFIVKIRLIYYRQVTLLKEQKILPKDNPSTALINLDIIYIPLCIRNPSDRQDRLLP